MIAQKENKRVQCVSNVVPKHLLTIDLSDVAVIGFVHFELISFANGSQTPDVGALGEVGLRLQIEKYDLHFCVLFLLK